MKSRRDFLTAKNDKDLRIKTAMILYALESSLGEYVLKRGGGESMEENFPKSLKERFDDAGRDLTVNEVVEATYFQEVLILAKECSKNTSREKSLRKLEKSINDLDIYEVRNIVCHPNRSISDNHWFKACVLASESPIQELGFTAVREALVAALAGTLNPPPDHWFVVESCAVPNNLPENLDHSITGFIGRQKIRRELLKLIRSPRVLTVSLVAPGGLGKTALALDVLEELTHDPDSIQRFDAIVFVTLKTERLTHEGVKKLENIDSLNQVREEVFEALTGLGIGTGSESFDELVEELEGQNFLICVDNLETILRDNQDAFHELVSMLPPGWKILITSRVPVDCATTQRLPRLDAGEAIQLAQSYCERTGGNPLSPEEARTLAEVLDFNPLAIKLAIDYYRTGRELQVAANRSRSDVVDFSFSNLIETFEDQEIELLEALFACGEPATRHELASLLDKSIDDIAESLLVLAKTSLIARKSGEGAEAYEINSSIRDFIVRSPRNIQLRQRVQKKVAQRAQDIRFHESQQREHSMGTSNDDFVDPKVAEQLKPTLIQSVRYLRKRDHEGLSNMVEEYSKISEEYRDVAPYHYFRGRVHNEIGDISSATEYFLRAAEIRPKWLWAWIYYGRCLSSSARTDDLEKVLEILGDDLEVVAGEEGGLSAVYFWRLRYEVARDLQRYDLIEQWGANWRDDTLVSGLHGCNYAFALAMRVRNSHTDEPSTAHLGLKEAVEEFGHVTKREGVDLNTVGIGISLSREILHFYERNPTGSDFEIDWCILRAVEEFYRGIVERGNLKPRHEEMIYEFVGFFRRLRPAKFGEDIVLHNPFHVRFWRSFVNEDTEIKERFSKDSAEMLRDQGYRIGRISSTHTKVKGFVFAVDPENKERIFVHRTVFRGESSGYWKALKKDAEIALKAVRDQKGMKAVEVRFP